MKKRWFAVRIHDRLLTVMFADYFIVILTACITYASVTAPDSGCNIVDGDAQNYESLQPTNLTGYFSYTIPCNGTLSAVNATGFCILTERTHQHVALVLVIYRKDNESRVHFIPADCDIDKNNSLSGIDYSFGSVNNNNVNITVTSDELLSIRFSTTCNTTADVCSFQPAVTNDTGKRMVFFLEKDEPLNELKATNLSLLFSATIVNIKQAPLPTSSDGYKVFTVRLIIIVASAVGATLVIIFATIILAILNFRCRKRKRTGKSNKDAPKSKCMDQEIPVYDEIPGAPAVHKNLTHEKPFCLKRNQAYGSLSSLSSPKSPEHVYDVIKELKSKS